MSVINKMLRDLDNRHEVGRAPDAASARRPDFVRGTATVSPLGPGRASGSRRTPSFRWIMMAVVLGVCVGGWWYTTQSSQKPMPAQAAKTPLAQALPVPLTGDSVGKSSGTDPVATAIPEVPAKAEVNNGAFILKMDTQARLTPHLSPSGQSVAKLSADASTTTKLAPSPAAPLKMSGAATVAAPQAANSPVSAAAASAVSTPVAPVPTTNPAAQRQAAAAEAMSQAQILWTAGSRDAAIELMREAVSVAERSVGAGVTATGSTVLVSLVRELARMELAEGQATRVLDMLTRLEPAIAGQADLWAVRGNAAQRLGRHQDSANAYLRALRLRPEEPRWMLGAAVSLAAQGQTVAAAELADKARAGGAVSREVATYLRQLGVPLRDQ